MLCPTGRGEAQAMKTRKIKERIKMMDKNLSNAEKYIARNANVESKSLFHLQDWKGESGHPIWMKNHMIPTTKKARAKAEKALERIIAREKARKSEKRLRKGTR